MEDDLARTVGGCAIRVEATSDGFRYAGDGSVFFEHEIPASIKLEPPKLNIKTPPANYSIVQCVPKVSGIPAVGIFFPQLRLGHLLVTSPHLCEKIYAQNCDAFVRKVDSDFGLDLQYPSLDPLMEGNI
jgi:hypothetical protein